MTQEVSNALAEFFGAVDDRDWERTEALMTTPIHIDYASFGAGDPTDMDPSDVVGGWRKVLPGFDHTHHQLGNVQLWVDGDVATVNAYATATHVIDSEVWTVVGRYEILLRREPGWRLSSLRFLFRYQAGATHLREVAAGRASAS